MAQDDVTLTVGADTSDADKALKDLQKAVVQTGKGIEKAAKESASAWKTFKGVLSADLIASGLKAVGSAAVDMGKAMIDAAKEMETISTELTTMTGNAEEAEKLLRDLQNFAAKTPFQLPGIANSAKQLLAFGFAADDVKDKLKFLGDIASGSGSQLSDVTQIFGQVAAAGKLTGERLNQLAERAIPIGPAIAKTMGVAETAVRDLVSKGQVNFKIFEESFKSLSDEGGIFFDSMIDKSETFDGVMSTLDDNLKLVSAELGKQLLPILKDLAKTLTGLIQKMSTFVGWLVKIRNQIRPKEIKVLTDEVNRLSKAVDSIPSSIPPGLRNIVQDSEKLRAGVANLQQVRDQLKPLTTELEKTATATKKLANASEELKDAFVGPIISDSQLAKNLKKIEQDSKKARDEYEKWIDSFGDGVLGSFVKLSNSLADNLGEIFGKSFASQLVRVVDTVGAAIGGSLVSGTQSTRGQLDVIEDIDRQLSVEEDPAERKKLQSERIKAQKEIGKIQEEEAKNAFTNVAAGVTDIFAPGFGQLVAGLLELAQDPEAFKAFIEGFVEAIPVIIDAIVDNLPFIIETIIQHLPAIIAALAKGMVQVAAALAGMVGQAILKAIDELGHAIGQMVFNIVNAGAKFLSGMANAAGAFITGLVNGIGRFIERLVNGIVDGVKRFFGIGGDSKGGVVGSVVSGVKNVVGGIGKALGFEEGIASVPAGFPNDTFGPVSLTSGEEVLSVNDKASIKQELAMLSSVVAGLGNQSNNQPIQVQLVMDGNVLADQILELDRNNSRTQVA